MEETEFNSIFGDPCLGTTKKLTIQYAFIDKANQQRKDRVFSFTRVSFAEHERVILTKSNLNHESSSKSSQSSFDNNTENIYECSSQKQCRQKKRNALELTLTMAKLIRKQ